jgi:hypothetical protein
MKEMKEIKVMLIFKVVAHLLYVCKIIEQEEEHFDDDIFL